MNFYHRGRGGVTEDAEESPRTKRRDHVSTVNHSLVYSAGAVRPAVLSVRQFR
jgi:hypothetical protein